MGLGNVLAGASFRSTLVCIMVFALALTGIGAIVITSVRAAMVDAIDTDLDEEIAILADVFHDDGRAGLVETVTALARANARALRLIGVFAPDGTRLAGGLTTPPAGERAIAGAEIGGVRYRSEAITLDDGTRLVVARSLSRVEATDALLARTLIGAGIGVMLVSVVVGYASSRHTMNKLDRVAATLADVSRGDAAARVPVDGTDQVDRIAREINVHLDRLAALTDTIRNTVIAIAHDLRTPLNRAFLSVELASEADEGGARREAALAGVRTELTALGDAFDTVLRIARIETSRSTETFAPLSLDRLAADVAETYAAVLEGNGQTLTLAAGDEVLVEGDREMLWQLLANLVENASLHTPAGTRVSLSVGCDAGAGWIEVADDGPGIPPCRMSEMLKPFQRLGASRPSGGTGLGLALVKAIAERHRASLVLGDAAPGLRVTVRFPVAA